MSKIEVPLVDLRRDFARRRAELLEASERVLSSGSYILGAEVEAFERECASMLGVKHALGVASGTDALTLALRAIDVEGRGVIAPAFTFFATASAIVNSGGRPVLADIEHDTYNLDVDSAATALQHAGQHEKTESDVAAIVPVHLYGHPADLKEIGKLARTFGLGVAEDAAQAFGARIDGVSVGGSGDAGCFSFFPTKNLAGFGDGGLITTDSDEFADKIRLLRAHGARKKYHHDVIGTNSRLDALQAALLAVRLRAFDDDLEARREHASAYNKELRDIGGLVTPLSMTGFGHAYHQYTLRVKNGKRDELSSHLATEGIQTAIYYPVPLHLQPALAYLGHKEGDFPVAEAACREVLSIPVSASMTSKQRSMVVASIRSFFESD